MVKNNVIRVSREIFETNAKISEDLRKIQNVSEVSMMFPYIYSGLGCSYVNSIMFLEFRGCFNDNQNYSELFGSF